MALVSGLDVYTPTVSGIRLARARVVA